MQVDEFPAIDPNEDLTKILPIQQKRTVAFINHFIMDTVSHLNSFAQSCESRFMEFEYKMQKIEASLLILESQLSSIPGLDNIKIEDDPIAIDIPDETIKLDLPEVETRDDSPVGDHRESTQPVIVEQHGVKAKEDPRFKKFFKMLQFGVPAPAVRLKMQNEGADPEILDNPDDVIPGLTEEMLKNESE
ncbi:unnamed protein product [Phaedon cochleariae]|uniref:WASH complex subunit 3 n=1 Tax=Phaedon cochleariae TaxID=80249 RepID=A0A9N9SKI5_PHACE|nr:unnamed protein product [Phaedon cochleariae]